jgi:hypothetical protein
MWQEAEQDLFARDLYLAGERVMPGTYRQIGSSREIHLDTEDFLPASLDGHVACYRRVENTWKQLALQVQPRV